MVCIQQCSVILLKLSKASYHYYKTLALQHIQQHKYLSFSINSHHSLRSLLQLESIYMYHEVSNSPLGNFSQYYAHVSTRSKLWIQQRAFPADTSTDSPVRSACGAAQAWKRAVSHTQSDNKSQQDLLRDSFSLVQFMHCIPS